MSFFYTFFISIHHKNIVLYRYKFCKFFSVNFKYAYRLQHMKHTITHAHTCTCLQHKKSKPCLIKKALRCAEDCTSKQQHFLYPTFYKIQRSYKKIMSISYFIDSVVKIALYLNFLYTKDNRLRQIKKKNE